MVIITRKLQGNFESRNFQGLNIDSEQTSISQLNGLSLQELAPTIIQVNDVTYA